MPPPGPPYHMTSGFRSVQVQWDVFMTPTYAEILEYVVTYWLANHPHIMTNVSDNSTMLELRDLEPGSHYFVVVQGINSFGQGSESVVGEVETDVGEVTPIPGAVDAIVRRVGAESIIEVTWTVSAYEKGREEGRNLLF